MEKNDNVQHNLIFWLDVDPVFLLYNIGEIYAMLTRHLHQLVIVKKLTGPK